MQIRERCQKIEFAVVPCHSAQSALLEPKLLIDQPKLVLKLYPDVSLSSVNHVLQASILSVR